MATFGQLANPWITRLGSYEPGRPIEVVARELGFGDADELIKVASNENALGPSPLAVKAMRKCATRMHMYPDGGAYCLKQALAARLGVGPEMITVTCGSNEAIEFMGHVFMGPSAGIVMADRAFVIYKLMAALFQAPVSIAPMRDFTHSIDEMLRAIRPETRIVFLPNPNNPTSTMVGQAEVDRLVASVPDDVIVCFDDAYVEILPPEKQCDTIKHVKEGKKVVVMRTFSKTYGLAGLRIGYVVAPPECIALLERVRQPFNVTAMALEAALAALGDDAHVARTRELVSSGIEYLRGQFDKMGLRYVPAVANFVLVNVGNGREVFEAMQRERVIVRPMDGYGLPEHVRISVGIRSENVRSIRALKAVLAAMRPK